MGSSSTTRSPSVGQRSAVHAARPVWKLRREILGSSTAARYSGSSDSSAVALAKSLHRAIDWVDPARVFGSRHRSQRIRPAPNPQVLFRVLRTLPHSPLAGEGRSNCASDSANWDRCDRSDSSGRRFAPSLRTNRWLNCTLWCEPHTQLHGCVRRRLPALMSTQIWALFAHRSDVRHQEMRTDGLFGRDSIPPDVP
jgi:hypothetical protein